MVRLCRWLGFAVLPLLLVGCNGSTPRLDALSPDRPQLDRGGEALLTDVAGPGPEARLDRSSADATLGGLKQARFIVHLHSIYSHDGCDERGFVDGKPNAQCLLELRGAICSSRLDAAFLTDHPANMSSYTMKEDLLFDAAAADQLIPASGAPVANRISCPGGGSALLLVGFETSLHSTPLGLEALPADPDLYQGFSDATDPALTKKRVQGLKALGAVSAVVHSEEPDLSVKTLVDSGLDAMEWYNIHANFKALLGSEGFSLDLKNIPQLAALLGKLVQLKDFMQGTTGGPHADLVYLAILDLLPREGFEKWQRVQASRAVTGLLGSDIHQNVSVEVSLCSGAMAFGCQAAISLAEGLLGQPLPLALKNMILKGGPLLLSDGARIDGYARLMRWLENRVLVPSPGPQELKQALRQQRGFGVFSVFGDPQGFYFVGDRQGTLVQLGESVPGPLTLKVRIPDAPSSLGSGGAPFSAADAAKAELRTRLLRLEATGPVIVEESTAKGTLLQKTVTQPGAYAVEIWIRPRHLVTALAGSASLADREYLWAITNPIRVTP